MSYRVYVVAAEYSAPLPVVTTTPLEAYRQPPEPNDSPALWRRLFFAAPDEGQSWTDLGASRPPTLADLLASAASRTLSSLHDLLGNASYADTCSAITDLLVTSMPLLGTDSAGTVNPGLIPLMLRATLGLAFHSHCQFVAGTADSGASAFASAVRIAKSRPATLLVTAGQLMPPGYAGQYRIRSVFTDEEQQKGLDMMAVGDVLMDALRRAYAGPEKGIDDCRAWLAEVRQGKLQAAQAYPAAMGVIGKNPQGANQFVTRYFRSADVAKAGCGAAAVVITSDPALLARIRENLDTRCSLRYRNTPLVEVMGVGEGTTNPRLLDRRAPLIALSSIRQALVAAAADAELPTSVFPDSAFAVVHDGFPSVELAFLLAIGLDWQRACLRMTTWWSNPYGGLLAFGHAVGASGLVHVCNAFHVFTGDRRYVRASDMPIHRFRREGSYAFTSAVGGPLSHIVVSILRGGVPLLAADQDAFLDAPPPGNERMSLVREEQSLRRRWRLAVQVYADRLSTTSPGLRLMEGITEIDVRSCAQALSPEDIDALRLGRLTSLVSDEAFASCRAEVIALIHEMRQGYLAARDPVSTQAARQRYNQGLAALLDRWQERGALLPDDEIAARLSSQAANGALDHGHEALLMMDDGQPRGRSRHLAKALKQCIRVPVAFLLAPNGAGRELWYLPELGDVDGADFVRLRKNEPWAVCADDTKLPWWNSRARRTPGPLMLDASDPDTLFAALMDGDKRQRLDEERQAELVFLRAFFAPSGPQAAIDLAMRDLGVLPTAARRRFDSQVPALFYKNDIIGSSSIPDVHEAYELLGRAVQRARGWFGMYASTCAQHGDSVSLVSLDRRLESGTGDAPNEALHARIEAVSNASRFARDVAEWCMGYGIRLRAVVSFGQGVPYLDVNDERSVASDSAIRGARLLDYVTDAAVEFGFAKLPWIVFDWTELADIADPVAIFARELMATSGVGWRWCASQGPLSPIQLERWDNIRFTVWYRAEERTPE